METIPKKKKKMVPKKKEKKIKPKGLEIPLGYILIDSNDAVFSRSSNWEPNLELCDPVEQMIRTWDEPQPIKLKDERG